MFLNLVRSVAPVIVAAMYLAGAMGPALGKAQGEYAVFNDHDPESGSIHVYQDWDLFLHAVVFDIGPSNRFRVSTAGRQLTGSRLGGGTSRSASWLEGNRVRFQLFKDETLLFLEKMTEDMVESAEKNDIATWNRNEQLAYWLNLHNLLVMRVAGENYPYRSAKKMHRKNWAIDMVSIKGVELSIQEIQDEIILSIWDDPMVIYGLFQGAVGGPSLRPLALQGDKIYLSLQKNGEEFVNSYRGVHHGGKSATVSKFYRWTARAFPDFDADLQSHLSSLADEKTAKILNGKRGIRASYFTWNVPDFYGGRMYDSNSSSSAAITALSNVDQSSIFFGSYPVFIRSMDDLSLGESSTTRMPEHTRLFLAALRLKFKVYKMPNEGITYGEMLTGVSPASRR